MKIDRPQIATQEWCEEHLNVKNPGDNGAWDWALMADIAAVTTANPYTIQNIVEEFLAELSAEDITSSGDTQ